MHPDSRAELQPWNLHTAAAERFTARQLRSAMVAESDLVLGATPRHRSAVVERLPAARAVDAPECAGRDELRGAEGHEHGRWRAQADWMVRLHRTAL